jgi:hypothetical protein
MAVTTKKLILSHRYTVSMAASTGVPFSTQGLDEHAMQETHDYRSNKAASSFQQNPQNNKPDDPRYMSLEELSKSNSPGRDVAPLSSAETYSCTYRGCTQLFLTPLKAAGL